MNDLQGPVFDNEGIISQRGLKNSLDLTRPYDWLVEKEISAMGINEDTGIAQATGRHGVNGSTVGQGASIAQRSIIIKEQGSAVVQCSGITQFSIRRKTIKTTYIQASAVVQGAAVGHAAQRRNAQSATVGQGPGVVQPRIIAVAKDTGII